MESIATIQSSGVSEHSVKDAQISLASICHALGYASIIASIAIWMFSQGDGSAEQIAHAERFGIFVGLWAPTFFILSDKYGRQ